MGRRKEKFTIRVSWVYQQHQVLYSINRLELHYSLFTLIPFNPFNPRGRGTKWRQKLRTRAHGQLGLQCAACSFYSLQFNTMVMVTLSYEG